MEFVELIVASGIFSVFFGEFSYQACVHSICHFSRFLPEDILIYRGRSWQVNIFRFFSLRLHPCLICS